MGTGIRIFIEYDYSNLEPYPGYDPAPFEDNVSLWDLQHDDIDEMKDYEFFSAIAGVRTSETGIEPLFAPRGLPKDCHYFAAEELSWDNPPISWLTAAEVTAALAHASLQMQDLSEPTRLILGTVEYLAQRCGTDRVRLVFAFT